MSKNIYRTAQGRPIDMDALRLTNEQSIAVGNMKTNARGDELGPGGVVVRTRNQVVNDYYQSNAVYTKENVADQEHQTRAIRGNKNIEADAVEMPTDIDPEILAQDEMMDDVVVPADTPQLRGRLADAVAKTANVEQKVMQPRRKAQGIKRI
jgi:hypothetical protein